LDLASVIDHTLLKPDATGDQIRKLCLEAVEYGFCSVCVNPVWVPLCAGELREHRPIVCSVAGFPLGATPMAAGEAEWAVSRGAGEIDMVLPVGLLKAGDRRGVLRSIEEVVKAVQGTPVKVILETCLLTREEKILACRLSEEAGAAFVKTSTGFAGGGATVEDIALMSETVGGRLGVKASGGIRTREDALAMIGAGATRIGASSSIAIVNDNKNNH
jgi:deoxyribose-phosphate aldolase